ncbi:MAG: hypothetical protein ABI690_33720 [Chloroflexota bacterium]
MVSKVTSLESRLLHIAISLPIDPAELLTAVKRAVASQPTQQTSPPGLLVDASKIQPLLEQKVIDSLQQLLLGLRSYGPAAVFGLPQPIESLFKLSLPGFDDANYPIYFVENQEAAMAILHHPQAINNPASSRKSMHQSVETCKTTFRNLQTQQMFRAFTANPYLYHEWRTIVDALYEDGEVAFETERFALLHDFGNVDDLTIDWDKIIMTLLHDVAL